MHRLATLCCVLLLALASVLAVSGSEAQASPGGGSGVGCNPATGTCRVVVSQPGIPGTSGGPGTSHDPGRGSGGNNNPGCHWGATTFPCSDPTLGWFDNDDGCYYRPVDPQPPPDDSAWEGHRAGDGLVYVQTCEGVGDVPVPGGGSMVAPRGTTTTWLADPPPGSPPPPPPPAATLAQWAKSKLQLPHLVAESNGGATASSYVGIPTWVWVSPTQWRPQSSLPAAVGDRSVVLTATPVSTSWSMGDGSSINCAGPGSPFDPNDPENPPCGRTYRISSAGQPQSGAAANDRYFTVQGSVTYRLHWVCTGDCDQDAGNLPDMTWPTTALPLRVLEVQTVVVDH